MTLYTVKKHKSEAFKISIIFAVFCCSVKFSLDKLIKLSIEVGLARQIKYHPEIGRGESYSF